MLTNGERRAIRRAFNAAGIERVRMGMRTFDINGMVGCVLFDSCFIAMMYGERHQLENMYLRDLDRTWEQIVADEVGADAYDMGILSTCHYNDPASLKALAEEWLSEQGVAA